jgi:hypothetical protein
VLDRLRRRLGRRFSVFAALAAASLGLGGCLYGFSGGAGLGSDVRTIAIAPFLNESDRFDVADEVYAGLLRDLPGRLGLRIASEETADVVLRGALLGYTLVAPNYRAAGGAGVGGVEVLQRQVQLRMHLMLVNTRESTIIWEDRALSVSGSYAEDGGSEEDGRLEAIELVLQRIVDGAQSRW